MNGGSRMKEITQVLRENSMKVTPQRIAIYQMLLQTKEHPSAETIYKTLSPDHPAMSLATIYKTMDSFKSAGLVQELNVGGASSRYDAVTVAHPHLICTCCGKVMDYKNDALSNLREKLPENIGFDIAFEQLLFYGICKDCKKQVQ